MAMAMRRSGCSARIRWVMPHFSPSSFCSSSAASSSGEIAASSSTEIASDGETGITPKARRRRRRSKSKADDSCAAKLTINIKTAMREFRLGDIPNAKVCGLPTERSLFTVIQGPHIDKKSREQFDIQTRKWRVTIDTETSKLREKLEFLKEHRIPGVEIKARFQYKTRMAWPLKPTRLSDQEKWKLLTLRKKDPKLYTAAKLAEEFKIEEEQVYDVLRSMEERQKHVDMFGGE